MCDGDGTWPGNVWVKWKQAGILEKRLRCRKLCVTLLSPSVHELISKMRSHKNRDRLQEEEEGAGRFGRSDPLNVNVMMMEVSFLRGVTAASPSSEATSINGECLRASGCWELYELNTWERRKCINGAARRNTAVRATGRQNNSADNRD